tara:strand:+ start:298 stop:2997 length:2700 start_codon:yes stop_codon:yes gene_type:complete
MTKYRVPDPLELLPHQSGLIDNPEPSAGASNNTSTSLDVRQRAAKIGAPIPIVFCRRVTVGSLDIGGCLIAPPATEGRFTNNATTNELSVNLMLVLSEGDMNQLQLRDVFQRACRVGSSQQTYNKRAGTFVPAYSITTGISGKTDWTNLPTYTGSSGGYEGMSTLAYSNTFPDGSSNHLKQIFVFVRDGMNVTRILDSTLGPSNNFIDLAIYLLKQSKRIPDDLLDTTSLTAAANFTNTNGLFFNGVLEKSVNLEDYLTKTANNFLLRLTKVNGKYTFKPRLVTNADHTICTTAITPSFNFTEEHILGRSFQIQYIPITERKSCNITVLWRQQSDNDIGLIRSHEVKMDGEAADGPFDVYDLSDYVSSESHAVKVAAFIAAKKKLITHTLRIQVRPSTFNGTISVGDIVRVKLRRETGSNVLSSHDYLYEVERLEKSSSGLIKLDLLHFPIDNARRSLVGLFVANATGAGTVLATTRTDFTCDVNSRTDSSTTLSDVGITRGNLAGAGFTVPSSSDVTTTLNKTTLATPGGLSTINGAGFDTSTFDIGGYGSSYNLGSLGSGIVGDSGGDLGDESNADDPLDNPISTSLTDNRTTDRPLRVGDEITAAVPTPFCAGGQLITYRGTIPKNDDGTLNTDPNAIVWENSASNTINAADLTTVGGSTVGVITAHHNDIDKVIVFKWRCPDSSTDSGFGTPTEIGRTDKAIEINVNDYRYARFIGTATRAIAARDLIDLGGGSSYPAMTGSITTTGLGSSFTQFNTYDGSGNRTSSDGYLTIAGLNSCSLLATFLGNTTDTGAIKGSGSGTAWQASVNAVQYVQVANVHGSLGGLGTNAAGGGCGGFGFLGLYNYMGSKGSYFKISGKWEFTNDQTAGVQATWEGINSIIKNPTDTVYSDYSYG